MPKFACNVHTASLLSIANHALRVVKRQRNSPPGVQDDLARLAIALGQQPHDIYQDIDLDRSISSNSCNGMTHPAPYLDAVSPGRCTARRNVAGSALKCPAAPAALITATDRKLSQHRLMGGVERIRQNGVQAGIDVGEPSVSSCWA